MSFAVLSSEGYLSICKTVVTHSGAGGSRRCAHVRPTSYLRQCHLYGGMFLPMIGALLDHSQLQTTAKYTHLASNSMMEASEQVDQQIAAHF